MTDIPRARFVPKPERFDYLGRKLVDDDQVEPGHDANGSPEAAYDRREDQRLADELVQRNLAAASRATDSFLRNCVIEARPGDEPIFGIIGGQVYARLDGYRISPLPRDREPDRSYLGAPTPVPTSYAFTEEHWRRVRRFWTIVLGSAAVIAAAVLWLTRP